MTFYSKKPWDFSWFFLFVLIYSKPYVHNSYFYTVCSEKWWECFSVEKKSIFLGTILKFERSENFKKVSRKILFSRLKSEFSLLSATNSIECSFFILWGNFENMIVELYKMTFLFRLLCSPTLKILKIRFKTFML